MRPGQQAPESNRRDRLLDGLLHASMRPGQQAPESLNIMIFAWSTYRCFNEARAASPGIRRAGMVRCSDVSRFNEARAASPGIHRDNCFREAYHYYASMRPGQQAPESSGSPGNGILHLGASMRPGQQAPESHVWNRSLRPRFGCFNEARAASPGILNRLRATLAGDDSFNEARAASPGIPSKAGYYEVVHTNASMRPGQQAPESPGPAAISRRLAGASMRPGQQAPESRSACRFYSSRLAGFNEARAASPGIHTAGRP